MSEIEDTSKQSRLRRIASWFTTVGLAEILMVLFTAVIMWATVNYTGYAKRQWRVMRKQLKEMRDGSKDTKAIADAAKKQADNTERLAQSAGKQVNELKASVEATRKMGTIGQDSLRFSQEAFVTDQRPYVWIATTEAPQISVGQAILWTITYKNYGKSPAVGLNYRTRLIFPHDGKPFREVPPFPQFGRLQSPKRGE